MSLCIKIVTSLFILQVSLVLVCPKTRRLNPLQSDYELNGPHHEEDDDDLTSISLSRLRVDGPAAAVAQAQDKLLLRRKIQGKQDEEDEETTARPPEIPAIIPGVTKIFNGILSGNLNDILHGAFSFAPRNVSYGINTVYNSVVGLPPPVSTVPTTLAPKATVASASATTEAEEEEDAESGRI